MSRDLTVPLVAGQRAPKPAAVYKRYKNVYL
jgi:hypothetical protein